MKYLDNNKEQITKKEFINNINSMIRTLNDLKEFANKKDKDNFVWTFENEFSSDFIYNTYEYNEANDEE